MTTTPHYLGHRQRLREKFHASSTSLLDYEVLELLLCFFRPRGDMKPLAKTLLKTFKSLGGVMNASLDKLTTVQGMGVLTATALKTSLEIVRRCIKETLQHTPLLLNNVQRVVDYLHAASAHKDIEECHLLFFDRKHRLIHDEVHQKGTLDQLPLYPREVLKRALAYNAGGVILSHNHPSGDPTPSQADITMTETLKQTLKTVDIHVLDHIVIGAEGFVSFRQQGLL